jgi:cell volume regulation protein A
VEVFELRLPRGAAITLVVREGEAFVPTPNTKLRAGDELIVVATGSVRDEVERRLRAVGKAGRLAGWYRERGQPE